MSELIVKNYSDKSIAVFGDTKSHKDFFRETGGKFNASLKDGPGWIFPKSQEDAVRKYVKKHGGESLENKITHKEIKNATIKKIKHHLSEIEKMLETLQSESEKPHEEQKKNGVKKSKSKFVPAVSAESDDEQEDEHEQEEESEEEQEKPAALPKKKK